MKGTVTMSDLRNFDDLDLMGATSVTGISEEVRVTVQPKEQRLDATRESFTGVADEEWTWQELRDYVVRQITVLNGGVSDNPAKVAGIMKRFAKNYGVHAAAIARYAFEVSHGYWNSQPIGITRFCKGSDPYFGDVILDRLGLRK